MITLLHMITKILSTIWVECKNVMGIGLPPMCKVSTLCTSRDSVE